MRAVFHSASAETKFIRTFYFHTERPLDHIAGQFIEMTIPHDHADANGIRRWFTLSSSPGESGLTVTVRYPSSGPASSFKQALQALAPGDSVTVSEPLGDFVLPLDPSIPLVWIAGGVGATPFRSMAKWLADSGERRTVNLIHSFRNRQETGLFDDVFRAAGVATQRLVRPAAHQPLDLTAFTRPDTGRQALWFISGPPTFVASVRSNLQSAGIKTNAIVVDEFLGYA